MKNTALQRMLADHKMALHHLALHHRVLQAGVLCTTPPCAASSLGDVGLVTVSGRDEKTDNEFAPGENIYGPFEAGL